MFSADDSIFEKCLPRESKKAKTLYWLHDGNSLPMINITRQTITLSNAYLSHIKRIRNIPTSNTKIRYQNNWTQILKLLESILILKKLQPLLTESHSISAPIN